MIFIDAGMNTNRAYREELPTQKLLRVMCENCDEFLLFQQSNAPAHQARDTISLLERETSAFKLRPEIEVFFIPFLLYVAIFRNLQKDLVYVLAATRERQVAPERLLQPHSTFSKSVMMSMGVSNLE